MTSAPLRSVITGGPGAGKSTLLAELERQGLPVFAEIAREILQAPGGMELRSQRPADFAAAMFEAELEAWQAAGAGQSVYDRGFPDIVGFLELEGLNIPAALDRACGELRYSGPIFRAAPWQKIYTPDAERIQDWEQAVASDAAVCAAWDRYGYRLIDLPLGPVVERASFVRQHLNLVGMQ